MGRIATTVVVVIVCCNFLVKASKPGYKIVGIDLLDVDETTISTGIHQACAISADKNVSALLSAKFGVHNDESKHSDYVLSGSVVCWGDMPDGVESHPHPREDGYVQVVSGRIASCGLRETMHVVCWGHKHFAKPPSDMFVQLTAGTDHMCGLKLDGSILCWGQNSNGESSPPPGNKFVQVSCGKSHCCAIETSGLATCWGRNSRRGEASPPPGVHFQQISASFDGHTCGIEDSREEDGAFVKGGRVLCWGSNRLGQSSPPSGRFVLVTTGRSFSCGIRADTYKIECWGKMRRLRSDERWSEISGGHSTLCGITMDTGKVKCWRSAGLQRDGKDATEGIVPLSVNGEWAVA